jgi:hypothetical protein
MLRHHDAVMNGEYGYLRVVPEDHSWNQLEQNPGNLTPIKCQGVSIPEFRK